MPRGTVRERAGVDTPEPAIEGALRHLAKGRGIIPVWSPDLSKPKNEQGLHPCMCPRGANCKSPGKHPAVYDKNDGQGFTNSFLRDEQAIRTALSNPGTRNYGIVPAPGEVFLDLDGEGLATWRQLAEELGKAPPTDSQRTTNGWHAAYQIDDDPQGNLFGIVTRRHPGGYVVGEGSVHPSGTPYAHFGPETVAKLPPAYIQRANEAREQERANPTPVHEVTPGQRHDYLRDKARYLHGIGMSDEEVYATLLGINSTFSEPKTPDEVRQAMGDLSHFPVDPPPITLNIDTGRKEERKPRGKRSRRLSTYEMKATDWLMEGWFPQGEITIIEGMGGMSKSTVMVDIITRITTGRDFPDGSRNVRGPANVLYITGEDDPERVLLPRVAAAGGDPERIVFYDDDFVMPNDLSNLMEELEDDPEIALVLIDPLFSHLDSDINTGKDTEVRRKVMDPLQEIAQKYGVVICVSRHVNKMSGQSIHLRGSGSYGALTGRARCTMSIIANPDAEEGSGERLFGVTKLNYGKMPDPLRFVVSDFVFPTGPIAGKTMPVITWLGSARIDMDDAQARNESARARKGGETRRNATLDTMKQIVLHHPDAVRKEWHTPERGKFLGIGLPVKTLHDAYYAAGGTGSNTTLSENWKQAPGEKIKADANGVQGFNQKDFVSWWVLVLTDSSPDTESGVRAVRAGDPGYRDPNHWRSRRAREAPSESFDLAGDD